MSLPDHVVSALHEAGLSPIYVEDLVRATLEEDLDGGVDVTSDATVPKNQVAEAELLARVGGIVAGLPVAEAVFAVTSGGHSEVKLLASDGDAVVPGTVVLTVRGTTRSILLGERTALNLATRLSGVATATHAWVEALNATKAVVRDTRKTMPLLRTLDKYAVRVGGGENHRFSLSESALVKDNHVVAAGGITSAFQAIQQTFPGVPIEIEVDDIDGAVEAVEAGADVIMLDNFTVNEVHAAVAAVGGRARLEVSGGLTLPNARAYAETGVDYLSVGALTHSVESLDLALDVRNVN